MKKILIPTIVMVCLLMACSAMAMGSRSGGVDVVVRIPLLPPIVELQAEPYYRHSDYYYHFKNERWYYSRSRGGPWADLPRDHYPKETRYKGKRWHHDKGRDKDDRYRDDRGRDDRYRDDRRDGSHDNRRNKDNRGHDNRR